MECIKKAYKTLENQMAAIKELTRLMNNTLLNENENCDIYINKAQVNITNKRDDLAILNYTKELTIQKRQLPEDHPNIARTLFSMGHCYVTLKQYEQGEKLMQEALQIRRKSLPGNHHDFALTYSSLGSLYKIIMKSELALEYFLKVREIHLASGEPDLPDLLITERGIRMLQASDYRVSSPSLK
ncbi:unnamed protein product [Rotaria sp. Silwood1]|nr:unnamed protein product [Rotaria sp. Silwood1]